MGCDFVLSNFLVVGADLCKIEKNITFILFYLFLKTSESSWFLFYFMRIKFVNIYVKNKEPFKLRVFKFFYKTPILDTGNNIGHMKTTGFVKIANDIIVVSSYKLHEYFHYLLKEFIMDCVNRLQFSLD